jgi:hypothetical protein
MLPPSLSLSPIDFVLEAPSDPARSTRFICELFILLEPVLEHMSQVSSKILKIVWDRDDFLFAAVSAKILVASPYRK